MRVFVDTSALYAVLDADDRMHDQAKRTWRELLDASARILTSNYVLVETIALLQHRLGIEAVRVFNGDVVPALETVWVETQAHQAACSALLTAGRRRLSLVDCVSFEVMRKAGIELAFAFDPHFAEQGFETLPDGKKEPQRAHRV